MVGIVILEFAFAGQTEIFVPLLVTTECLSTPIVCLW